MSYADLHPSRGALPAERPTNGFAYFHRMTQTGARLQAEIPEGAWRAMASTAPPVLRNWLYARAFHLEIRPFDAARLAFYLVPETVESPGMMKGTCLLETFNARYFVERQSQSTPEEAVWVVERGEYIWSFDAPSENCAVELCDELNERDLSPSEALAYAQSRFREGRHHEKDLTRAPPLRSGCATLSRLTRHDGH